MKRIQRLCAVGAAVIAALLGMLVGVGATGSPASAAPFANGQDPVILLHGLYGNAGQWSTFIDRLKAAGYTDDQIVAIDYNTVNQSNVDTADEIATLVDETLARTGATKVDIVGHSMGSLNSRWCIKYAGCAGKVDDWVSLGGPNHGSQSAYLCLWQITCRQMAPGSAFLTRLNTGPTLPADVHGTVIWSRNDGLVIPAQSAVLPGVELFEASWARHMQLMSDERVVTRALAAIAS